MKKACPVLVIGRYRRRFDGKLGNTIAHEREHAGSCPPGAHHWLVCGEKRASGRLDVIWPFCLSTRYKNRMRGAENQRMQNAAVNINTDAHEEKSKAQHPMREDRVSWSSRSAHRRQPRLLTPVTVDEPRLPLATPSCNHPNGQSYRNPCRAPPPGIL
jgi:hypothetical protein